MLRPLILTRVDSASYDTAQGVPCSVVKPVMEAVEAFLCQVPSRPEVEVGIKLVDNTLEPQHRKQSRGESYREQRHKRGSSKRTAPLNYTSYLLQANRDTYELTKTHGRPRRLNYCKVSPSVTYNYLGAIPSD